ncbi:MAG: hypothetical protein AAF800_10595 [Planctomycetota bacterium]
MSIRAILLSGLISMSTTLIGCGESQDPTVPEAATDARPQINTPVSSAADRLPPGYPEDSGDGLIVVNFEHLAKTELEAALRRVVDNLDFGGEDPDKAEFQRGMIDGAWSALFDEISYRQFILADHGINAAALAGPFGEGEDLSHHGIAAWVRLDEPGQADQTARALAGLRMIDTGNDFAAIDPPHGAWSRAAWKRSEDAAHMPESADASAATPGPDAGERWPIADLVPPDMSLVVVSPELSIEPWELIGLQPKHLRSSDDDRDAFFTRMIETMGELERFVFALRWSPRFHYKQVLVFTEEHAAADFEKLRQQLSRYPPNEHVDPNSTEVRLMQFLLEQPLQQEGRCLSFTLDDDEINQPMILLKPETLMMPPLAAAAFLGRE